MDSCDFVTHVKRRVRKPTDSHFNSSPVYWITINSWICQNVRRHSGEVRFRNSWGQSSLVISIKTLNNFKLWQCKNLTLFYGTMCLYVFIFPIVRSVRPELLATTFFFFNFVFYIVFSKKFTHPIFNTGFTKSTLEYGSIAPCSNEYW